jgi:DNA-binding transcriptional LysR family regulator
MSTLSAAAKARHVARTVSSTSSCPHYVDAARQIVAQIKEAELRASGEYEVPRGTPTITMPLTFGRQSVLPLALDFLREHPEIDLNVLSMDRVVHLVEEHVDVGVRLGQLADSSLYAVKVGEFRLVTCASPAYLARKGRPGVARAPSYQVLNELKTGALVSILDEYDGRTFPVHLVYVRQGLLPLKVRAFLDWMTPRLREALRELEDLKQMPTH